MDNPNITWGKWQEWMHKLDSQAGWKSKLLGDWEPANDYVHSREEIEKSFAAGNITKGEAERLIRLRYKLNRRGEKVIEDRERDYD